MSGIITCDHCGHALALADAQCSGCGQAVPMAKRRDAYGARAERLAEAQRWTEAARALEPLLSLDLPPEELRLQWRQRGAWLLRSGDPGQWDLAEAALAESLRLDDSDLKSHALWLDLLERRGSADKARQWYEQRLAADPADAVAAQQLKLMKLAADFKAAPPPKLDFGGAPQKSLFARILKPSTMKVVSAVMGLGSSGFTLLYFSFGSGGKAVGELQGVSGVSEAVDLIRDPWSNGIMALLCAAYLAWAWRQRRG